MNNFAKQSVSRVERRLATRRVFFQMAATVLGVGLGDALAEPYLLEVTEQDALVPQLPAALDGLKVAQLTDLHRGELTPDEVIHEAVRKTVAWQPDLVVLTGDFVRGWAGESEPLARMLTPLRPRLGLIGCLGNHDYYDQPKKIVADLERIVGVRMLRNAACTIAPGLWCAGIEDTTQGMPDTPLALADVPDHAALLFLTHNPVGVRSVEHRPCLALAGHTHGGQVRVPGLPPHFPPGMEGFGQIEGWGRYGHASLYISRGIGVTGYPLRLNCPPELTLLTLRPVGATG